LLFLIFQTILNPSICISHATFSSALLAL